MLSASSETNWLAPSYCVIEAGVSCLGGVPKRNAEGDSDTTLLFANHGSRGSWNDPHFDLPHRSQLRGVNFVGSCEYVRDSPAAPSRSAVCCIVLNM